MTSLGNQEGKESYHEERNKKINSLPSLFWSHDKDKTKKRISKLISYSSRISSLERDKASFARKISIFSKPLDLEIESAKSLRDHNITKKLVYEKVLKIPYNRIMEYQAYYRAYKVNKKSPLNYTSLVRLGEAINADCSIKSENSIKLIKSLSTKIPHKEVMKKLNSTEAKSIDDCSDSPVNKFITRINNTNSQIEKLSSSDKENFSKNQLACNAVDHLSRTVTQLIESGHFKPNTVSLPTKQNKSINEGTKNETKI